jgi:hypothetical protein
MLRANASDAKGGRWRGELTTRQHTDAPGKNLLFGGREVSCGFSGSYTGKTAKVEGTALVGKVSVAFRAELQLLIPMQGLKKTAANTDRPDPN